MENKCFKLYTDGCYVYHLGAAGIGGYIEDSCGNVIFNFSKILESSELFKHHEIEAVKFGLKELIHREIKNVNCYMDDKVLSEILNLKVESEINYYVERNQMLKSVFELLSNFDEIKFNYIPRSKNKRADILSRKHLLEITPDKNQVVETGLVIKNLYAKEHFLKKEDDVFRDIRRDIKTYYVFSIYQKNNFFRVESYLMEKIGDQIKMQSHESADLSHFWIRDGLNYIADCLNNLNVSGVCVAVRSPGNSIEKILRGLEPESKQINMAFKKLEHTISSFDSVVIHRDDVIMNMLFPKRQKEIAFTEDQLFMMMKMIGENDLKDFPSSPLFESEKKKSSIKEVQDKCFGEYVKLKVKQEIEEKKAMGVVLQRGKKSYEFSRVERIKFDLEEKGIIFL